MTKYFAKKTPCKTVLFKWIYDDDFRIDAYWRVCHKWCRYAQGMHVPRFLNQNEITEKEAFMFILENE